jgi:hypothetical protein
MDTAGLIALAREVREEFAKLHALMAEVLAHG